MVFEWNQSKNEANRHKHGLDFQDVELVFEQRTTTFEDDRQNYGERRLVTLGLLAGRVVVVVHTPREDRTRVISFRKANSREQQIYQERLGAD